MKKIITILASVLVLCGLMVSMASCFGLGSVDMVQLKADIEAIDKNDNNITATFREGTDETDTKAELKNYRVTMKVGEGETESLEIVEFANTKLAKIYEKGRKLRYDIEEKSIKIEKDINEARVELGEEADEIEEMRDYVVIRKGTVVISGDKAIYEKVFEK